MDDHDDLVERLRTLGTQPIDPARQSADLTAMAGVRPLRSRRPKLRAAAAAATGLLVASTGLAAADVLPDAAQHTAHTVLARVGVDVPNPARYYNAAECGATEKKNHGAYVRDDHTLAKSDCGKPVHAVDPGEEHSTTSTTNGSNPCEGKPSWAGDKSLTKEERSAAIADWKARCGDTEATEPDGQNAPDVELKPETTEPEKTTSATKVGEGDGTGRDAGRAEHPGTTDGLPDVVQP